tara:strand:+ start:1172 stop:1474 length:303 start_codon:yes stop_codon:yes gene_type:complete
MNFPIKEISTGLILGFCIGFALKKSIKILVFVFGAILILLFMLEFLGVSAINNDELLSSFQSSRNFFEYSFVVIKERIKQLETTGAIGAVAGGIAGFKFG